MLGHHATPNDPGVVVDSVTENAGPTAIKEATAVPPTGTVLEKNTVKRCFSLLIALYAYSIQEAHVPSATQFIDVEAFGVNVEAVSALQRRVPIRIVIRHVHGRLHPRKVEPQTRLYGGAKWHHMTSAIPSHISLDPRLSFRKMTDTTHRHKKRGCSNDRAAFTPEVVKTLHESTLLYRKKRVEEFEFRLGKRKGRSQRRVSKKKHASVDYSSYEENSYSSSSSEAVSVSKRRHPKTKPRIMVDMDESDGLEADDACDAEKCMNAEHVIAWSKLSEDLLVSVLNYLITQIAEQHVDKQSSRKLCPDEWEKTPVEALAFYALSEAIKVMPLPAPRQAWNKVLDTHPRAMVVKQLIQTARESKANLNREIQHLYEPTTGLAALLHQFRHPTMFDHVKVKRFASEDHNPSYCMVSEMQMAPDNLNELEMHAMTRKRGFWTLSSEVTPFLRFFFAHEHVGFRLCRHGLLPQPDLFHDADALVRWVLHQGTYLYRLRLKLVHETRKWSTHRRLFY